MRLFQQISMRNLLERAVQNCLVSTVIVSLIPNMASAVAVAGLHWRRSKMLYSFNFLHRLSSSFFPFVFAVGLSFGVFASHAHAAETEDENDQANSETESLRVPEVVVSASRVVVPIHHVGSSLSVLNAQDIQERQPQFVHELLREIPSVAVSQSGPDGGLTQVRIRGAEGNHTKVMIDGLDLANPFSSDEVQIQHFPISSIDSIEVLRGPQSAIHGSESIGGVISLTTPIPNEPFEGRIATSVGSKQTRSINSYVGSAGKDSYVTISANHHKTDGISAQTNNKEKDGFRNNFVHLKTGVNFTEEINATGVFIQTRSDGEYDSFSSNQADYEVEKTLFGTTFEYGPDDSNLSHKLSVSKSQHDRTEWVNSVKGSSSSGETKKWGYQGTLESFGDNSDHSTTFAVDRKKSKVKSGSLSHPQGGQFKLSSYSIEHRVNFADRLFLSASGRRDKSRYSRFHARDSYRLTGAVTINGNWRIHSSVGTGVKNPTVSELFGWTTQWRPNPDLLPETSKGFDVGVERQLESRQLTVDVTAFSNRIENLINPYMCAENCTDGDFRTNVYQAVNQPGVSKTKGVELSIRDTSIEKYETSINATYLRGFDANGNELVRRPSFTASFNVSGPVVFSGYQGKINLNIQHTGKQSDIRNANLDEFTLVNLGGHLQLSPELQLTAKISNIFDKTDHAQVGSYGVTGRTFALGLRYEF